MILTVNGRSLGLADGASLADMLEAMGMAGKRVAVERNGEIVPRNRHAATRLDERDRLEIVVAVGGG